MKHAPDGNYQRELVLDAQALRQSQHAPGGNLDARIHFFFKSGDKYGKGHIVGVLEGGDETRVRLSISLRIQPDGSRNVETDEGILSNFMPVRADTTPPLITILGNNPATVQCGVAYTDGGATATDDKDGNLTSAITVSNTVNTAAAGQYTIAYSVTDAAGNTAAAVRTVQVRYNFTGFLPPIGGANVTGGTVQQPLKTFKAGSKIPVKFTIACAGQPVTQGVHTLQVIKWNNATTAADPLDASPADAATQGNQFRWAADHWQYVLDTRATGMSVGTWELRATLADGSAHSAFIALK